MHRSKENNSPSLTPQRTVCTSPALPLTTISQDRTGQQQHSPLHFVLAHSVTNFLRLPELTSVRSIVSPLLFSSLSLSLSFSLSSLHRLQLHILCRLHSFTLQYGGNLVPSVLTSVSSVHVSAGTFSAKFNFFCRLYFPLTNTHTLPLVVVYSLLHASLVRAQALSIRA